MAIGTYISIITLNGNGLKAPTKTHRKNIKSSKGEATSNIQGKPDMLNS